MSINGPKEPDLNFAERTEQQAYLSSDKSLRPVAIKNKNKGLQVWIFYRNLLSLKKIKTIKDNKTINLKKLVVYKRK